MRKISIDKNLNQNRKEKWKLVFICILRLRKTSIDKNLNQIRRKTISVHSVHLFFCKKGCPQRATVNSLRGKAFQLWPARNAFFLAETQATWTIKCSHTLDRNPLLARNANTHAGRLVNWGITWKSTHSRHQHQPNVLFL